jgi:predicted dehydrogenase
MRKPISRREFVGDAGALALGAMIVPRHVLGGPGYKAPSATLNVACVGVGGMGMSNMNALIAGGENIVAVCDVDFPFVERSLAGRLRPNRETGQVSEAATKLQAAYSKAAKYADFREMLERQRDIDAVVVATPDHTHAAVAVAAMRAGKHVYVQKPMAYSVHECRLMARVAKEKNVVTQMGNQGHSGEGTRRIVEWVRAGVVGPIREAYIYTNRPVNFWAQGLPRPSAAPASPPPARDPNAPPAQWNMGTVNRAISRAMTETAQGAPAGLNWDLFLGPAPDVPYHPVYHPFSWRGWLDYGGGALGDMGAHLVDQAYWALGLEYPTSIMGSSTAWGYEGTGQNRRPVSYPLATTAQYEFPARGAMPPVKMYWYDSGILPPRPPFMPDEVCTPRQQGGQNCVAYPNPDGGGFLIGEKGTISWGTYGDNARIFPESLHREAESIPKSLPRITGSHEMNWASACKGEGQASAPFDYSAKLVETMLLGVVALRAGQGRKIMYDGPNMRITNMPEANQYLTREYRKGWEL